MLWDGEQDGQRRIGGQYKDDLGVIYVATFLTNLMLSRY